MQPAELERALVVVVDDLSRGPRQLETLDLEARLKDNVLQRGDVAEAIERRQVMQDDPTTAGA